MRLFPDKRNELTLL